MQTTDHELEAILKSFVDAPQFTQQGLEGSFWRLFDIEGRVICPFLVLAPEGLIGNGNSPSLDVWQIINGQLALVGVNGTPAVVFQTARISEDGSTILAGAGIVNGRESFYLVKSVVHPLHEAQPAPARCPQFLKQTPAGKRRPHLVVVPAGQDSLHPFWLEQARESGRNWDLCIGYYGADLPPIETPHEYLAHIPRTKKFRMLHSLFHPDSPLWDYETIWLPDDDLLTSCRSINLMFHLFRKFGLDLAQPALMQGPGCFPNHPLTVQRPGNDLRLTEFVEIMCPVFSRRALKICIGTMRDTDSGYGLDHLWPALLGYPRSRVGIIDAVPVAHTRPIGATYQIGVAIAEQDKVLRAYEHRMRQYEGVL